jgi:hypothetical protein
MSSVRLDVSGGFRSRCVEARYREDWIQLGFQKTADAGR